MNPMREVLLGEASDPGFASMRVGSKILRAPAAPGIGRWIYRVTRLDQFGVWGVLIKSTVREMREENG